MRLALVNVGGMADSLARVAPRLLGGTFTAVVDADPATARGLAGKLGDCVWATSIEQLHQQHGNKFEAWAAATPAGLLLAADEKRPLDPDPAAWLDGGGGWQWGHSFRFLPSIATVKESLDSGKLGAPGLVRIHHWQPSGDARMAMLAQLDLACWLIDQTPTVVYAQQREATYLQVHLGFADDRMAVIDCQTALPGDEYYSLSVIGSTGAAYADDHHNMQLLYAAAHPRALRTSQGDRALLATLQEFLDATNSGRAPQCGAPQWRRARTLLAAAERSLQSGEAILLAEGTWP